jgi:hypothetical protein
MTASSDHEDDIVLVVLRYLHPDREALDHRRRTPPGLELRAR